MGNPLSVTGRIQAGSAAVQGTRPRVAVEGYAGSQLLGGVALDVVLPWHAGFDGTLRTWLPLAQR